MSGAQDLQDVIDALASDGQPMTVTHVVTSYNPATGDSYQTVFTTAVKVLMVSASASRKDGNDLSSVSRRTLYVAGNVAIADNDRIDGYIVEGVDDTISGGVTVLRKLTVKHQ